MSERAKHNRRNPSRTSAPRSRSPSDGKYSNTPGVNSAISSAAELDPTSNAAGLNDNHAPLVSSLMVLAQLASNIVHEVNNPLGTALSSCQLALRFLPSQSPPQLTTCIDRAISSVRRASEAVKVLVRVCCLKYPAEQSFDIRDVLRFTALIVQSSESGHPCTIDLQLASESTVIRGNPIEIHIALASLVWSEVESGARWVCVALMPHLDTLEICISSDSHRDFSAAAQPMYASTSATQCSEVDRRNQADWVRTIIREHGGELTYVRHLDHSVSTCLALPRCRREFG